jgi:RNA polymerase sigma-70 factor (ECF subfamily)
MADDFARQLIDHLPRLRRFAISLTRSRDLADDLVQTTCEKAWAGRASFVPGTRLDAWLFRILRNTWIDRARRASGEGQSVDIEDAYGLVGQDGRERTEQRLMLDATAKAIAQLPEDQREVLVLVCVEELSYREVAQMLGVPTGTVMSRLARARTRLGDTLGINVALARSSDDRGRL